MSALVVVARLRQFVLVQCTAVLRRCSFCRLGEHIYGSRHFRQFVVSQQFVWTAGWQVPGGCFWFLYCEWLGACTCFWASSGRGIKALGRLCAFCEHLCAFKGLESSTESRTILGWGAIQVLLTPVLGHACLVGRCDAVVWIGKSHVGALLALECCSGLGLGSPTAPAFCTCRASIRTLCMWACQQSVRICTLLPGVAALAVC